MKRLFALAIVAVIAACNKPAAEDCRKALVNMQHLLGTENLSEAKDFEAEVRRCKGGSSKEAVECAIKAQTLEDLRKCDFYKTDKTDKTDKAPGSGGSGAAP